MTPCQGHSALFDDLTRTDEARQVCKRLCARLIECRAWALRADVAGLCGGLTEQERAEWRETFDVQLPEPVMLVPFDRRRAPPRAVTAERRQEALTMNARGFTQRQIASALGVTQQCVWYLLQTAEMREAS